MVDISRGRWTIQPGSLDMLNLPTPSGNLLRPHLEDTLDALGLLNTGAPEHLNISGKKRFPFLWRSKSGHDFFKEKVSSTHAKTMNGWEHSTQQPSKNQQNTAKTIQKPLKNLHIQKPLKNHSETTQKPLKNHSKTTQKPLKNHSKATQEPLKNHSKTTRKPLKNHSKATQEPLKNHSKTTQKPLKNHSKTTQKPLKSHSRTTQEPLKNHSKSHLKGG